MLMGDLHYPETYEQWLNHSVWREALEWIQSCSADQAEGKWYLRGDHMIAKIQHYDTLPRSACKYEAHRVFIDIQYCLTGTEVIEWAPVQTLVARTDYDPIKDVTHYKMPERNSTLLLTPKTFVIFLPSDAHMPKIGDGVHSFIKKAVVKVNAQLFK